MNSILITIQNQDYNIKDIDDKFIIWLNHEISDMQDINISKKDLLNRLIQSLHDRFLIEKEIEKLEALVLIWLNDNYLI